MRHPHRVIKMARRCDRSPSRGRGALFALMLAAALMSLVVPAFAATSAQKMAEARSVASEINALDTRVSVADEKYLQAADKHSKLLGQKRAAAAQLAKAQKRLGQLQVHLSTRAVDMYRSGPLGIMDVLLGARSFEDFAVTWDILRRLNASDASYIIQMKQAKAEATAHMRSSRRKRRRRRVSRQRWRPAATISRVNWHSGSGSSRGSRSRSSSYRPRRRRRGEPLRHRRHERAAVLTAAASRRRLFLPTAMLSTTLVRAWVCLTCGRQRALTRLTALG